MARNCFASAGESVLHSQDDNTVVVELDRVVIGLLQASCDHMEKSTGVGLLRAVGEAVLAQHDVEYVG